MTGRQTLPPARGRATFKSDRRRGVLRWLPAAAIVGALLAMSIGTATSVLATEKTIDIVTGGGSGAVGTNDPIFSFDYSPDTGPATIIANHSAWTTPITGARWINASGITGSGPGCAADDIGCDTTVTYKATFELPVVESASIAIQVLADNQAIVSLNGHVLVTQPAPDGVSTANFTIISTGGSSDVDDFEFGTNTTNTLTVTNLDGVEGVANGFSLKATITYEAVPIVVHFTPAPTRQYDGTRSAAISSCTVAPAATGLTCAVAASATADYDDKNVGSNKPVTAELGDFTLSGPLLSEYTDRSVASTNANITQREVGVTAATYTKTADGNNSAAATPTVTTGSIATGDTAVFSEIYRDPAGPVTGAEAGINKELVPSLVSVKDALNASMANNYAFTFISDTTGWIRPNKVTRIEFSAQPIDTQVNTAILHTCTPGGTPCGASSAPIQVAAYDAYDNRAGLGAPGADIQTKDVSISLRDNRIPNTVLKTASTSDGVATFSGTNAPSISSLTVNPITLVSTPTQLKAVAAQTSSAQVAAGSDDQLSNFIRIVDNIKACDGSTCESSGKLVNKHASYGKIEAKAGEDFFVQDLRNVSLTTQFVAGSETKDRCVSSTKSSVKNSKPIGDATDLRVVGLGVTETGPTTRMLIVIPKDVMKAAGVTARSASSFDVCLGAIFIGSGTASGWTAKNPATSGTQLATISAIADPDGLVRYWGAPLDCSDARIKDSSGKNTSPCISLRTKQKSDIRNALGADAASFMNDADIGIIIEKPANWDGKGGVY